MVAGFPEFSGKVFGTKDGAQTWKVLLDGAYHQYSIVTASPNKTLYTYDYAEDNFYYSYNGGGTWHYYYLPDLNGNDGTIDFTSASVGWATSFPEFNGSIMKSIDGGLSWQHDTTVTSNLSALQFPSPDTGYAVGDGGVIMKYVAPCPVTATILPAGNIIACKGTDVILTCENAGNNFNYQWEKDGVAIPGATDQTYTNLKDEATFDVIVTSAFGCSDTSDPISIDRLKKPKATITALGNLDICNTGSVDLQATSGNNFLYQWKKNGNNISGATNQVYTATTTGGYKVKITNANGCSKTSKVTSVTTSCKEISQATNEDAFTLFPNPSSGNLSIQLSGDFTSSPLKISITDVLGRKVWEEENIPEGNFISLQFDEKMTNGIYLFTIQSQHASAQKLFEVQR
jgi:hypothetical protein